ncbi:MAG: hypothetical protein DHS20C16_24350 [Phycisphaerae bacterium]|nr:MAG: hypothetical protein DHS20C16_24350 [Phycisphaerae bacterium]
MQDNDDQCSVRVITIGPFDASFGSDIRALGDLIDTNPDLRVMYEQGEAPAGSKPMLTTSLAIVGAVTGIAGLVLQAVEIWRTGRKNYAVTVTEAGNTYTVTNLSKEQFSRIIKRLNTADAETPVSIELRRIDLT